jgi:RNA polymerase sigma-70 factor (ECF subfamily)
MKPEPAARSGSDPRFDPGPWQAELRAFLARMGACDDLDDLVQETFLRAVRKPPEGPARAYLYQVALNLFRDRGRRLERGVRVLEGAARIDHRASVDPADTVERRDLAERAWRLILTLPDHQRAALILRIDRQFTYREAARVLGCSEATVRQHFYLGMKAVRAVIAGVPHD